VADEMPSSGEGYALSVSGSSSILINGWTEKGILYGIQTLRQILRQEGAVLPCVEIEDYPRFSNRGFLHDVSRGRVPSLKWLKELADIQSYYKINQMQLYVEHTFLFPAFSEMWRDDTPLTAEEIMEFDRYCLDRGIELIPSLPTFGHLYKLLNTRTYRHLCELEDAGEHPFGFIDRQDHHTLDISNEDSFKLVEEMITQYMPLFTSKKFNIGADETFDLGKGRNQERLKKEGNAALYMGQVKRICRLVVDRGHIPMLWGDIMLEFPEFAKELPPGTICLNWGYAADVTEKATRTYAEYGVRQYACPGTSAWNLLVNAQENAYLNISKMCHYANQYNAEGILNTDWGDFGHLNHPRFSIPPMIYGAIGSWCGELPQYEELNEQISRLEYKDGTGKLMEIVGRLAKKESFGWREMVWWKEKHSQDSQEEQDRVRELYKEKAANGREKNVEIDLCILELSSAVKNVDSSVRNRIQPYLLAAEGMKLFHDTGILLFGKTKDGPEARQTAQALEQWYHRYKQLWRTVSRESELYRISETLFWYADLLRELL
jgi:hypothetical protein